MPVACCSQGEIVQVPVDAAEGVGPHVFYVPVGNRLFPPITGAIELALTTGAPLLPVAAALQPNNQFQLTIGAPLDTGEPGISHDQRVWHTATTCGEFMGTLWHDAPFNRTWGDMSHFLMVSTAAANAAVKPGQWVNFDVGGGAYA